MPFKCVVPGCRSNYYHVRGTPSVPMMRFPLDPDLLARWLKAICREDFTPTAYSHVCIMHFPPDQLIWHEYQKRADGFSQRARRRFAKLRPTAVPSIFEVDPSTHKVRSRLPTVKSKPKSQSRCEILTKYKVSFKPEMWEDSAQKKEEEKVVPPKRPRGRPRKQPLLVKKDEGETVKSEFVSCCALGCPNTSENYIMNCLPRDSKLKHKWVEKIDRLDWVPDDDSALCEVHFEPESWDMDVGDEKILKDNALPTQFLHGEAIKSWVTLDNSPSIENVLGNQNNGDEDNEEEEQRSESEEEDPEVIVKREALEPEIDMVEGCEDVLSRDTSSTEEQFETIYCDSTFNEDEENSNDEPEYQEAAMELEEPRSELENPLSLDSVAADDRQIQDRQVSCMADSEGRGTTSNYLVISNPQFKKVIKRRSSSMLNDDFQCPICERRLSRRKNLEIHMEKLHPNGELSEYQKRKKLEQIIIQKDPPFKKPPPPLTPIVPSCLLTSPLTLPPSKIGTLVTTPQATPTLLATTMVTAPSPMDPNPTGGEMKKQFLLLLPKPMEAPPAPTPPEPPKTSAEDPHMFSVSLFHIPLEKRVALKEKLKELVEAVMTKNLNPDKIIIAYDRT